MKKLLVTALLSIAMSFSVHATSWEYSTGNIGNLKTYTVFSFDNTYGNSFAASCDSKYKEVIIALVSEVDLTNRENSIVSFKFDDDESTKIKFRTNYSKESAWMSTTSLKNFKQNKDSQLDKLFENLKSKRKVTIGMVKRNGKSHYFDIELNGSSAALNNLFKVCKI